MPIDYYCGITMDSMAALCNLIGGVDYDLEMSFAGHDGVYHQKGLQHLDGNAIVDYFRARKNATVDTGSDQARANRAGLESRSREIIQEQVTALAAMPAPVGGARRCRPAR